MLPVEQPDKRRQRVAHTPPRSYSVRVAREDSARTEGLSPDSPSANLYDSIPVQARGGGEVGGGEEGAAALFNPAPWELSDPSERWPRETFILNRFNFNY